MSRAYHMFSCLEVGETLPESDYDFWKSVLNRCLDRPTDVLEGNEQINDTEIVAVYHYDGKTHFSCEVEMNLCGGYSEDEYAEDFQKAMRLLTKEVLQDFNVSLSLYYLEHDPDLYVSFDRQDLAV